MWFHSVLLGRCGESRSSMSFSLPILHHRERTYYLDVFARDLSRGMGRPTFPFGLVVEWYIGNLYARP